MLARFDLILYAFVQGKPDSHESEDAAYAQAEKIVGEIVQKLQHDRFASQNYLDFDTPPPGWILLMDMS